MSILQRIKAIRSVLETCYERGGAERDELEMIYQHVNEIEKMIHEFFRRK